MPQFKSALPAVAASTARQSEIQIPKPSASSVVSKLATLSSKPKQEHRENAIVRSCGFSEAPSVANLDIPERDENLVIVESLEMGPRDHKPLANDPKYDTLEPNSGIRLSYVLRSYCYLCSLTHLP
jgi:minichromosome maintenance protein 10